MLPPALVVILIVEIVTVPASPHVIRLNRRQRQQLQSLARAASAPYRRVLRARIVLAAAGGQSNTAIATRLGVHVDTVRKWRRRYYQQGLDGLSDRSRSGRPRQFPAPIVAQVKALACELPAQGGTSLARWSCLDLAREAADRGVVASVSASTVRRWLHQDAIKPWQHRSWIFPRDPHFAVKASRVLDLYHRKWDG